MSLPAMRRSGGWMVAGLVTMGFAAAGCDVASDESDAATRPAAAPIPSTPASTEPRASAVASEAPRKADERERAFLPSRGGCETAEVFHAGTSVGTICVDDATKDGLTVVDLSDGWTPRVFAADVKTGDAPAYRAKYIELANAKSSDLGLHGVASSMSVLAGRLVDEERHACDAAIDRAPLATVLQTWSTAPDDRSRAAVLKNAESKPAVRAMQAQLVCSGFLKKAQITGAMGTATQVGLEAFRRRHMMVGTGVDAETLEALTLGGDELAFRALLRGLRERVADAAGLVEDGSASGDQALVVDRELDLSRFAPTPGDALGDAALDLVDAATDRAARELGWTSPEHTRAALAERGKDGLRKLRVAVALPPPPAYHTSAMDLRVEIDRGDVVYEAGGAAKRKALGATRSPSFVVYAKDGDVERALLRWSTTIGGWKKERSDDGEIGMKYKESDVGERVWRRVVAAPAWMPPDSTPETDLLHENQDGTVALKRDLIQPGYRNAYGLVMLIHEEMEEPDASKKDAKPKFLDHGIRTHGSVDYKSITRGESHGCHRLYNQLALRLSGFLLQHRVHARKGKMHAGYKRTLEWNEQTVEVDVPTRGYLYEMDPPVPVKVLPGRIVGKPKPVSSLVRIEQPAVGETKAGVAAPKQG